MIDFHSSRVSIFVAAVIARTGLETLPVEKGQLALIVDRVLLRRTANYRSHDRNAVGTVFVKNRREAEALYLE